MYIPLTSENSMLLKSIKKHHIIAPRSYVSQEMRESRQVHKGMAFWLTGLSGSGKSTLAHRVEAVLFAQQYNIVVLDGDAIRTGLCSDLGFSQADRHENNRRIAELAKILVRNGVVCLCAFISPSASARHMAKDIIGPEFFREVFISCSLEECERRDCKGFYSKARQGKIPDYTGIDSDYETPEAPDCTICTESAPVERNVEELLSFVYSQAGK